MIIPAPVDIAFNLFGLPVYRYGITMAIAIFFGIICANVLFNKLNINYKKDIILEYAPMIIIGGILCARFYFCILNFHYYFGHPVEILDIRQGGLSIHGGIAGGILSMIVIAHREKIHLLNLMDSISCAAILGQSIGRWGNYFNSEAYGLPVAGQNWGLFIPETRRVSEFAQYSLFHPTFLYESILDFGAFFILLFILLKSAKKYKGLTFFSYLIIYSVIRFFIEKLRIDSALNINNIPIAEIVSLVLFLTGVLGIIFIIKKQLSKSA